ncbi:CAP domain-containing protein [Actinoplanes sp. NPDC023714]|uniref:CAP domain-containing protein n=1 Tax=Actinoplanes sp. NPDC023714 TaxID=3154322 RepID=UPI0033DD2244
MPLSAAAKFRYTLVAGTTAVVIGTAFTVAGLTQGSAETPSPTSVDVPLAAAGVPGGGEGEDPSPSSSPEATSKTRKPSPTPAKTTKKAPAKTTKKATRKPLAAAASNGSVVEQVLAHINAARAGEGLGELTLDAGLSKAAAVHTQLMIDGCGLSHQCPDEAGLGDRFSAQDVKWSSAGENIGYGSSAASNAAQVKAANGLTDSMLAEVPPEDGHRKNLLNKGFTRIGLSVVRDGDGVTWMTQDFVG